MDWKLNIGTFSTGIDKVTPELPLSKVATAPDHCALHRRDSN
jgi:hypothetical protein